MKSIKNVFGLTLVILILSLTACQPEVPKLDRVQHEKDFVELMEKHLRAVSEKDLETLALTMHPTGKMQLILPSQEITVSVDSFLSFHQEWFKDAVWTFDTEILNTQIGDQLGMAVVESVYREPERNGKPYFNRMIISYLLEKTDDKWYVIKDHASSVEKGEIYTNK